MDSTATLAVSTAVITIVQLLKWKNTVPDRWAPIAVIVFAVFGVAVWGWSEGTFERTKAFEYFAAVANVSVAAAGVFGFVRASQSTVMSMQAPPTGAGAEPPVRRRGGEDV